jgi:transposase
MCAAQPAAWSAGEPAHDVTRPPALGVAANKKSLHGAERDSERVQQARTNYHEMIGSLNVSRLKFVDESGVNLAMTRRYGRAPKGVRVVGAVPQNYGQQVTILGALSLAGVGAVMTVEGATDAEVFRAYVKHVLGPTLVPGDIVMLDTLAVHKVNGIQQMLARRRSRLRYLPPYSPDLAPIELCWSKLKTQLRTAKARTRDALNAAIAQALATVTPADAHGWFAHCGLFRTVT